MTDLTAKGQTSGGASDQMTYHYQTESCEWIVHPTIERCSLCIDEVIDLSDCGCPPSNGTYLLDAWCTNCDWEGQVRLRKGHSFEDRCGPCPICLCKSVYRRRKHNSVQVVQAQGGIGGGAGVPQGGIGGTRLEDGKGGAR